MLHLYRDCSGATLLTNMTLTVKNGCNGTSQVQQPLATAIPVLAGEPISVNLTATDCNPG
jgi:hypothetical protein